MNKTALVIGASGGIASTLIDTLLAQNEYEYVYTVSRSQLTVKQRNHIHDVMDTCDEQAVKAYVTKLTEQGVLFDYVVCATGILHQSGDKRLKPEKRLEDMNPDQFQEYFKVNSILPAIWLQKLVKIINKQGATIVFFSARVGSISDNSLGGWYGYRASKAALNMLVKTAAIEYKRRLPNTILVCYHPGTVDTSLSKPFQANVKPEKLFTPQFTCDALLSVTANLNHENSPFYLDWAGNSITW